MQLFGSRQAGQKNLLTEKGLKSVKYSKLKDKVTKSPETEQVETKRKFKSL